MLTRDDLLELIEVKVGQDKASGSVKQFYRVDGTIKDYKLHPSNQYVIILTMEGFYYIFHLEGGDIRGKQKVHGSSKTMQLDPAGLYVSFIVEGNKVQIYELAKGAIISELTTDMPEISLH